MKLQSAQNNQNNLEKEVSWRKMFQFHNKTVVIEQLLLWRKDRNKPIHIWLTDFQQGC